MNILDDYEFDPAIGKYVIKPMVEKEYVYISDEEIDSMMDESYASLLLPMKTKKNKKDNKKKVSNKGIIRRSMRIVEKLKEKIKDNKDVIAEIRSIDTKCGNGSQHLLYLIARKNKRFSQVNENNGDGLVTDVSLVTNSKTFLLFITTGETSKNCAGKNADKNKMKEVLKEAKRLERESGSHNNIIGVVVVIEGDSPRKETTDEWRLHGSDITMFLTSKDGKFIKGDITLWNRLCQGWERFGERAIKVIEKRIKK